MCYQLAWYTQEPALTPIIQNKDSDAKLSYVLITSNVYAAQERNLQ